MSGGNWSRRGRVDTNGRMGGRYVSPRVMLRAFDAFDRGLGILEVYDLLNGEVTYNTLFRWRKRPKTWKRYVVAKWWVENLEHVRRLQGRGWCYRQIVRKLKPPWARWSSDSQVQVAGVILEKLDALEVESIRAA